MANFNKVSVRPEARTELHDLLGLTGAEVSVNHLPAGAGVPFVHSHRKNEEIYAIHPEAAKLSLTGRQWRSRQGTGSASLLPQSASFSQPRIRPSVMSASR